MGLAVRASPRGPHREGLTVRPSRPECRHIRHTKRPDAQARSPQNAPLVESSTLRGTVGEFAGRRVCVFLRPFRDICHLDWLGWRSSNGGGGGASRRCSLPAWKCPGEEMRPRGELRQRSGPEPQAWCAIRGENGIFAPPARQTLPRLIPLPGGKNPIIAHQASGPWSAGSKWICVWV